VSVLLPAIGASLLLLAAVIGAEGGSVSHPELLDPKLTGRQIYARVLQNRFESFTQDSTLSSGDRSGRSQQTELRMHFKDFRDAEDLPSRGVLSKTLVKYTHPFDLRHAGYLVIQNHDRANDQFVYFPTRRQTVRVSLRGEPVFGTDFSFEDVIPRELEDATYRRLPDEEVHEVATYVVEALPTALFDSEYSKFVFYVDPATFVPLWTRYWDLAGVEIKQMRVLPENVEQLDDVFVPMQLSMKHLLLESHTTLKITHLVPNPPMPESLFEVRRLEAH
jgi:hypothetical protein